MAVRLEWFRGAADEATLSPDGKSMVIYGSNGSGKSSFVDAVEFAIQGGRIEHLATEHSGRNQEYAIPNVLIPNGVKSRITIQLKDKPEIDIRISKDGHATAQNVELVDGWDYGRTILRQDEVALFIAHKTKGQKYSALLPLLGLHHLEIAAENVHQITLALSVQSKLNELKGELNATKALWREEFGKKDLGEIKAEIDALYEQYCKKKPGDLQFRKVCSQVAASINERLSKLNTEQRRYMALLEIADGKIKAHIEAIRAYDFKIAKHVQPLIFERLEVLEAAQSFIDAIGTEKDISCPACGQKVSKNDFVKHVQAERNQLETISNLIDKRREAVAQLEATLGTIKTNLARKEIIGWREDQSKGELATHFAALDKISPDKLRKLCRPEDLAAIEKHVLPIIAAAKHDTKGAPPEAVTLSNHQNKVVAAQRVIDSERLAQRIAQIETLLGIMQKLEEQIRKEIRAQSEGIIQEISKEIEAMWSILHPNEPIAGIHLYVPNGSDKAIDVGLKFYGVDQLSPRLTLSEGYRNGLGLCIFLAMAMRESKTDRPIFLDDVFISFDRNHRGMVIDLLKKKFSDRQVIVFTHDRDWYTDLRQLLNPKQWKFGVLLPYETPKVGIRLSNKTTTFDDARQKIKSSPDSAANDARKIMDIELAPIAERLELRFPFLRGEKNDRRMASEFLERLIADAPNCLKRKSGENYVFDAAAVAVWKDTFGLLVTYANRGSHSPDVTPAEATKLIDECEKALSFFVCDGCKTPIWIADSEKKEHVQCECGNLRWLYGKAV